MSVLPNGYTELHYIQSSGTQYIDTGFKPSGNALRVVIRFRYTSDYSNLSLFGNHTSTPYSMTVYGSRPTFWVGNTGNISCGLQTSQGVEYTLDATADNGTITALWNDVEYTSTYSGNLYTEQNMFIFGGNSNGTLAESGSGYRLYAFQIYDNGTLVRDFIPAKNNEGTIGLYDLVNDVFYTNAGTGTFTGKVKAKSAFVMGSTVPVTGKLLSDFAHGDIVKVNENGVPAEFYVAKHDYESGLNGTGRTLLVRIDCYDERIWDDVTTSNRYSTSEIDAWLNGNYKALLDWELQNAIGETTFYYTYQGNSQGTSVAVSTLTRSVFLLSLTEYNKATDSDYTANVEGSALPIAQTLLIAKYNGTAVNHWTRSPATSNINSALRISATGYPDKITNTTKCYSRPCFTLPSNALFHSKTLLFKGVK